MNAWLADGPLLWFLNRGSGVVVLVALTAGLVLGLAGADRDAGGRIPAFLPQELHRNLSVLALVLTGVHAATAVLDSYVDIRWWQSFVPFGASYEPVWMALGALALDLMLVVAVTSAARRRLGRAAWHRVHLLGYAVWPVALAHGAGMGTDATSDWARWTAACCAGAVLLALVARLVRRRRIGRHRDAEGFASLAVLR